MEGFKFEGAYNQNRKNALEQFKLAVLVKIVLVFILSFKTS